MKIIAGILYGLLWVFIGIPLLLAVLFLTLILGILIFGAFV